MDKPLVSILISAYNAREWVVETLQSALAQTWPNKEIIFVDDGSTDNTLQLANRFLSRGVKVISQKNSGLSAGLNTALANSRGEYLQYLDADDLMLPDKIERQLSALREGDSKKILLSSPWAPFYYRTSNAKFVHNSLWEDLTPAEWLFRKMSENIHMQNATWLVSRELAEAAGPWDVDLHYDQDGDYFARVLMASEGTRFVPETGIFYRMSPTNRISYLGSSSKKKTSLFRAMRLHFQYLLSLEDSDRTRKACLTYLQNWSFNFYPDRMDIVREMEAIALEFGGELKAHKFSWKYSWLISMFGMAAARWAERVLPATKAAFFRYVDKVMYKLQDKEIENSALGNR